MSTRPWEEGWFFIDEDSPEDECGFATDYPGDNWFPDEDIQCERRKWDDCERCIWHAEKYGKPLGELKNNRKGGPERLDGAYLNGVELGEDIPFSECVLIGSSMVGANLQGVDFARSELLESNLTKINLRDAKLINSSLESVGLTDADLVEANLSSVNLHRADLSNANFARADISKSNLRSSDLSNAELSMANLKESNLEFAELTQATLHGTELMDAHLYRANLRDASLFEAYLNHAQLGRAVLTNAILEGANLISSDIHDANLANADLGRTTLTDATLKTSDLTGTSLREATLVGTALLECQLDDADLRDVNASGANFENATLVRADLRGADFFAARLYQTQLADVRINSDTGFGDQTIYAHPEFAPDDWDWTSDWDWDETPLEAAAWTYRRLEHLHEEHAMSERAREYHVKKEEAHRRHARENRDWREWAVYTANYHLSRHGENPWQVVKASVAVIVFAGFVYPFVGGMEKTDAAATEFAFDLLPSVAVPIPEPVGTVLANQYFSAVTFTTLGYGDIQPASGAAQLLATVESFVGALLMALLVFVLGRRTTW